MMRAVALRVVLFALIAVQLGAQTLDEAVRALARKVIAQLQPADAPRVAARSLSNLGNADAVKARIVFERALKRPSPRSQQILDITLTIAQNVRGYLLVADYERNGQKMVSMVPYLPVEASPAVRVSLERELLFEQDEPILDVAVTGEKLRILSPDTIDVYVRNGAKPDRLETRPLDSRCARDARGRLEMRGESIVVAAPGRDAAFNLSGLSARFSAAGNTIEAEGWPPFFSYARSGDLHLFAGTDGRVRLFDSAKLPAGAIESWGSDIASGEGTCGTVLASSSSDRDQADTLSAFDIVDRKPAPVSEAMQFSGPITALWANADGALAVSRNLATGRYAAYRIAVRCPR